MKNKFLISVLWSFLFALSSFAFALQAATNSAAKVPIRVGLILDKGGKDDKSFNSAAYLGATLAEKELGIQLKYIEATDDAAIETMMRSFAQKKYDLVIGIGFAMTDAVKKVSPLFPEVKFALIDAEVPGANVTSLLFEEHQGSYLVGALAAMNSKNKKVGFLGGMDVPLIHRFQMGYEAGAKSIDPKIAVIINYVGVDSSAWNNPAKAKELSLTQYRSGVDVIFGAAGASNNGLFDAVEETKKLAIGVDSNQNWVKPGLVLTSMLKRVDVAVLEVIKETNSGKFKAGTVRFGLKDKGIDYAVDQYNSKFFTAETSKKMEKIKQDIIAGKIKVPDYYKK